MSHRGDLTERMLWIPLMLAERPHSQSELAEAFKIDRKTIKRDMDAVTRPYPIVAERRGREVFYGYGDGYRFRPPPLTPGEAATLVLAQQSIAATGLTAGTPFARHGQSLLAKVRASLPEGVRAKLDALANVFGTASMPAKDFAPHAGNSQNLFYASGSHPDTKRHP